MDLENGLAFAVLVGLLVVVMILLVAGSQSDTPSNLQPCSTYSNTSLQDVPARCVSYWEKHK